VLRVRPATRADVPAIEELIATPARSRPESEPSSCIPRWLGKAWGGDCLMNAAAPLLAAGFRTLTLVATLPGEPLYQALGFTVTERFQLRLPDQVEVPVARMSRNVM